MTSSPTAAAPDTTVHVHHAYAPDDRQALGRSYTSGLTHHGHPEFIIFTADYASKAEQILRILGEFVITHGHTFQAGDTIWGLVGGHDKPAVRLLPVTNPDQRLPIAYYRHIPDRMRAFHIVYTYEGVWPWEPGYDGHPDEILLGDPIITAGREYVLTADGKTEPWPTAPRLW